MNLRKEVIKMDMLNIIEFKDYMTDKRPKEIIYNDENNSDYMQEMKRRCYSIAQPLHMCLTFNDMIINTNPDIVQLQSKNGKMRFNYVCRISIETGCLLGDIVTLYCGAGGSITAYTLIIR